MKSIVVRALVAALIFLSLPALSQRKITADQLVSVSAESGSVCYARAGDAHVFIPAPGRVSRNGRMMAPDTIGQIKVTYTGFSPEAKKAFQYAVNIWRTLIPTTDTIYIQATWRALGAGVLGSAGPSTYYANFEGAQRRAVYYPIALAEKISRRELNKPGDPDINASFSSSFTSWYFGTDGQTPAGRYDLVSVVLHEIGHGLGVFGFFSVSGTTAVLPIGVPGVYDTNMGNQAGVNVFNNAIPSTAASALLQGGPLFYNSPLTLAVNANKRSQLYAPSTFEAGSSLYHLEEDIYPKGNKNSLMTPFFNTAEAIHNPGPLVMAMLKDMGWNSMNADHTRLKNTETDTQDFNVSVTISGDTAYDASLVKLFYRTSASAAYSELPVTNNGGNQFSGTLPKSATPGTPVTYQYYFSVYDAAKRTFTFPGIAWIVNNIPPTVQVPYAFVAGPDSKAPMIDHAPTTFIRVPKSSLTLSARITDIIGVQSAAIEYKINGVAQSDVPLVLESITDPAADDSTYTATLPLPALTQGDVVTYRIRATDSSVAHNIGYDPATGYHSIDVFSLAAAQNLYANDFNTPTSDFFGDDLFGISTAAGFGNGAINSSHPYPIANPKDSFNYVYMLRVPIVIKPKNAVIRFDEIALVEPNDAGSVFGGTGFYDYVVAEGSTDDGETWQPFLTGYNCRAKTAWLNEWNSGDDGSQYPNSTGEGTPALYVSREVDMLSNGKFKAGDRVIIRFRLKSDQLAAGWGWAIDNLKIQVDVEPPVVLHDPKDFINAITPKLDITTVVTDNTAIKTLAIEYKQFDGTVTSIPLPVQADISQYTLSLEGPPGSPLVNGDVINYRIVATDSADNTTTFPADRFFRTEVLDFALPALLTYTADFNSANTDFVTNFFTLGKPANFETSAFQSEHPYPTGFGLTNTSNLTAMLRRKIKVSDSNPFIAFREIALVEPTKDYVIVEGSDDKGVTWNKLVNSYSAKAYSQWQVAYAGNKASTPQLFRNRVIDITASGFFSAGDDVLIRFRLFTDGFTAGWGWIIDDLSIQGSITGLELPSMAVQLYPNPVTNGILTVEVPPSIEKGELRLINIQGQEVLSSSLSFALDGKLDINVKDIADGFYVVKLRSDHGLSTHKIIIRH